MSAETKSHLSGIHGGLDPVKLLREMRAVQQNLVEIADKPVTADAAITDRAYTRTVPRRIAHGMERRRGKTNGATQAESDAASTAAGPVRGGRCAATCLV